MNIKRVIQHKTALIIAALSIGQYQVNAQNKDLVKFNVVSRGVQEYDRLDESDNTNVDLYNTGTIITDLGININPDKNTEIKTTLRTSTQLGGFYWAGTQIDLRRLSVKGKIENIIGYQLGDIFLEMSPYTLYNNNAEGSVNQASIFNDLQRDIAEYDNFNIQNKWWQQGAFMDFTLAYRDLPIQRTKFEFFLNRNRGGYSSGGNTQEPAALHAGGRILIEQSKKLLITANYINLFNDRHRSTSLNGVNNPVITSQINYKMDKGNLLLKFNGEAGSSSLNFDQGTASGVKSVPTENFSGYFFDGGANLKLKNKGLTLGANYRYVSQNFYSAGAQSKRIAFGNTPAVFEHVFNDPVAIRPLTVFDITRDTAAYNSRIQSQLMAIDPRLNNATPYGTATPNRAGITLKAGYTDSLKRFKVNVSSSILSDIVGVNTTTLRKFMVNKASLDINANTFLNWKKKLTFNGGFRYGSTSRAGDASTFISMTNTLIEGGVDIEVSKKFELLFGYKTISFSGNEFLETRSVYNEVLNYNPETFDGSQTLIGFGGKYKFSERSYITLQYHQFEFVDSGTAFTGYSFDQFMFLFNLKL